MKEPGPDHPIAIKKSRDHIVVQFHGMVICDSHDALVLREANYSPMLCLPRKDVRMDFLERSTHRTHCPYKGDAVYFNLGAGDARVPNAAWSYEAPFPAMEQIREHLAFYVDKVEIRRNA